MRLRFLLLLPIAPALAPAQDIGARLDSAMRVAEKAGFSGVVRIERDGKTLLERGYGMANRATKSPFTASTVVQIGSNTKDFTAVAILQLQQAGRLSLADSLGKFFRGAPADKRGITVRQLMNHRAGFPQVIGGDFDAFSRAMLVDSAMKTKLLFTPGTRESYSNTGFSLLAAIIEQVTGKTFDAYVRDNILAPAGLKRTGFLLPAFALGDMAHGYAADGSDRGVMPAKPHASDGPYWNLRGNGGMLSTVADMHAFYSVLFESEKFMTASTRSLRFDPQEPIALAGSDGVNVFLYERFPGMRVELIVASTNAAMKAGVVRRQLAAILGLPGDDGEPDGPRKGGVAAPAPIAKILADLVKAINAGEATSLRNFIAEHFASEPDAPTLEERVKRFGGVHENLGALTVVKAETFPDGPLEFTVNSATRGVLVMKVVIDRAAPYKIHGIQLALGG